MDVCPSDSEDRAKAYTCLGRKLNINSCNACNSKRVYIKSLYFENVILQANLFTTAFIFHGSKKILSNTTPSGVEPRSSQTHP